MAGCDPMADPREESEPLLSRTRGGSARHFPAGVSSCHSVQVGPGEPRPGEGPGRAGVARGVPPARAASLLSLRARIAPPAGVRAGPGGAARQGAAFPRAGRLRRADPGPGQGAGFSQILRGRALPPTDRAETPRSAQGQPAPCSPHGSPGASCFPWIALVIPRRKHFRFPQFLRGK